MNRNVQLQETPQLLSPTKLSEPLFQRIMRNVMGILQKPWCHCPKPLRRVPHVLAKLALTVHVPRSPSLRISRISNPERFVVAIYAFALAFPLLSVAMIQIPVLGPAISQSFPGQFLLYAILLPLSITYFAPLLFILLSQELRPLPPTPAPPIPLPFQLLIFFGGFALLFFYPVVSYFLWYRYRVAWVLSFTASTSTICLEVYAASTEGLISIVFWVFGMATNLLILHLLWRCRSEFFNRAE